MVLALTCQRSTYTSTSTQFNNNITIASTKTIGIGLHMLMYKQYITTSTSVTCRCIAYTSIHQQQHHILLSISKLLRIGTSSWLPNYNVLIRINTLYTYASSSPSSQTATVIITIIIFIMGSLSIMFDIGSTATLGEHCAHINHFVSSSFNFGLENMENINVLGEHDPWSAQDRRTSNEI